MLKTPREVEKAANAKWNENKAFRNWLRSLDSADVSPIVNAIAENVSQQIDCTECANCCMALTIAPSSKDVKRLADGLGLSPVELRNKYLKKDLEGDLVIKQHPCPFLKNKKCSVYEYRPETCRSYPHMKSNHMAGRGWHIVENTLICPIVFNIYERLKQHYDRQWRKPSYQEPEL